MAQKMYIAERVTNIADLERYISSAYTMSQLVVKELSRPAPDMESMAQVLKKIPESKKESVLMLVTGYALGLESESENRTVAAG